MKVRREDHDYDLAGLPYRIILQNVPVHTCPSCGERSVTIPDVEGLHRRLALDIVAEPRPLLPQEIRLLRKTLDWTAEQMSRVIGVDVKTVSRWENGKQKMGPVAERLLRLIVRDLEPRPAEWVRTVLSELSEQPDSKQKPSSVTWKATSKGWQKAA